MGYYLRKASRSRSRSKSRSQSPVRRSSNKIPANMLAERKRMMANGTWSGSSQAARYMDMLRSFKRTK